MAVTHPAGLILNEDRGELRFFLNLSGIANQENGKDQVDHHEYDHPQPGAGEKRQPRQSLGDPDCERICDRGGKSHVHGKNAHPQTDECVPPQRIGKGEHQRDERDDFFEDPEKCADRHEEERDYQQKQVFASRQGSYQPGDDRLEQSGLLEHRERDADHQQEDDDRDDRQRIGAPEHFDRGSEPAPWWVIGRWDVLEGGRVDHLAASHLDPVVAAGGDDKRENPGEEHEAEQDCDRLQERFFADLSARFWFHGSGSDGRGRINEMLKYTPR